MTNPTDLARDISFAVFRVAKLIEQPKLKSALESAAIDLVAECGTVPYLAYVPKDARLPYLPYIEKLNELINFAEIIDEIRPVNAHVLQRELQSLYLMIAESFAELPEINKPILNPLNKHENSNSIAIRQSAILAFIRELPDGCRMRDLHNNFREVSERTLRNDLQDLKTEGLIERVGKGPFGSFRAVTKHEIIAL
jgi:hypothetical protein